MHAKRLCTDTTARYMLTRRPTHTDSACHCAHEHDHGVHAGDSVIQPRSQDVLCKASRHAQPRDDITICAGYALCHVARVHIGAGAVDTQSNKGQSVAELDNHSRKHQYQKGKHPHSATRSE